MTTRSIPALRAFLEGERMIVEGRWHAAPEAYRRAIALDSTFWLAYWRFAFASHYWGSRVDSSITAAYRAHRASFPERDRLLIEADLADTYSASYERARLAAERYPDNWLAWWTVSEYLAHSMPLLGTTGPDLRAALERTLSLNPRMVSAWHHLFWEAMRERDTVLSARILQELTALRYDSISLQDEGRDQLPFHRYLDALARSGGALRDTTIAGPILERLASPRAIPSVYALGAAGAARYGFPRAQVEVGRLALRRNLPPRTAAAVRLAIAIAQAERGAWDSSLVTVDEFATQWTDSIAPLYPYRIAVIGAWLGALNPVAADLRRTVAVRAGPLLSPASRAELAWLDGVLAVARRDTAALSAARRALRGTDSVSARVLDRSLAAFQLDFAGRRDEAADSLAALERERAEVGEVRDNMEAHPFLTGVNRMAAARWMLARGEPARAAPLLTWHENVYFPYYHAKQANIVVQGLAYLEQARVAEALGRSDLARDYYRQFLWRYETPVAAHRHLVDEARQALARLESR